jgi:hypothetical protein
LSVTSSTQPTPAECFWAKLGALVLVLAALGLPINDLVRYALLVIATVIVCLGSISRRRLAWLVAVLAVVVCVIAQSFLRAPRIEEGHNVFLIDGASGALEAGLPQGAFHVMAAQFNARYPPEHRCSPAVSGCWRGDGFPREPYAFSADGLFEWPAQSRRVRDTGFADPIWLRLGFINEGYNWNSLVSDIERAERNTAFWAFLHRWSLEMPWFVMYRFPADYVGSELCWRGEVLWEGANERFELVSHSAMQCRELRDEDAGRRIFGLAIKHEAALAMELRPTGKIRIAQLIERGSVILAICVVLAALVSCRPRRTVLAFGLIALTLVVVLLNDASFIGGVRPFDSGDDGLVYDGFAREMLRQVVQGNISAALQGGENVFYFTPGMRYLRAFEHVIFGDTYLGYLSLVLLLPFLVLAVFRRFLPAQWALVLMFVFVAIPVGVLFGSSLVQYVKWASRGFADPAAYILFLAGFALLVGRNADGPHNGFAVAWATGLLFALALFVRPNIAPAAGVLLGASGVAALWQWQFRRVAGLTIGFLPVLGIAFHNWFYGGAFVPFTATAAHPGALVMPPSAWLAAADELAHFNFRGEHVAAALHQIGGWLAGPSESVFMAPFNAAALVIVARMALWRNIDPWLRLTASATLAQQCVGIFYATAGRYYYLTWLLTFLVTAVWVEREGIGLLRRRYPNLADKFANYPGRRAVGRLLQQIG